MIYFINNVLKTLIRDIKQELDFLHYFVSNKLVAIF